MNEANVEAFRLRYRFAIVERLLIQTALSASVFGVGVSAQNSRKLLIDWLDTNSRQVDASLGAYLKEPATAGVYADEALAITDGLKALVEKMAKVLIDGGY